MSELQLADEQMIESALIGDRGPSQERIAKMGLEWIALLLKKNQDYGDSVFQPPVLKPTLDPADAILTRASDKITRIAHLNSSDQPALIAESLEDSMRDLGAYCLLYLCRDKTK